jgi:hypothetical protein
MGHILGLGTLWGLPDGDRLISASITNPRYLGTFGNQGNAKIGGTGEAVIENTGSKGVSFSHWKESIYDTELMTPILSTTIAPISALTVLALKDLGYTKLDETKVWKFKYVIYLWIGLTITNRLKHSQSPMEDEGDYAKVQNHMVTAFTDMR